MFVLFFKIIYRCLYVHVLYKQYTHNEMCMYLYIQYVIFICIIHHFNVSTDVVIHIVVIDFLPCFSFYSCGCALAVQIKCHANKAH